MDPEAKGRLDRIPSFARGMVVKGIEKFAAERNIRIIDEAVVKQSREEMIEKRGAMFPFLKKFIKLLKNKLIFGSVLLPGAINQAP